MDATQATDFFTWQSLLTFQGSTMAVMVVAKRSRVHVRPGV
jgi:hypothetical protein